MLNVKRWYFVDQDFLVFESTQGKKYLTLRNGVHDVKTTNRIARMCGLRKVGPLKRKGDKAYYELEVRDGKEAVQRKDVNDRGARRRRADIHIYRGVDSRLVAAYGA